MSNTSEFEKKSRKNPLPSLAEIPIEKIGKIKTELEELDPKKIIEEALKVSATQDLKKDKSKKSDLQEQAKIKAISNFITNLKNKNEKEIEAAITKKIDDYNINTQITINKLKKEKDEYLKKYESIQEEKKLLVEKLKELDKEHKKLKNLLKDSQDDISKMQTKLEIFKNQRPLFDEFKKEFPNQNPGQILQDIKNRIKESQTLINEYNKANKTIEDIKNQKSTEELGLRKTIGELNQKLIDIEQTTKGKNKFYEKEIISLKNELSIFKGYKEENIILHKMLFKIYNLLYAQFGLDKNIKIDDKYLNIIESDFNPNIFDNDEIIRYIKIMAADMHHSTSSKLLRETITCANMIIRTYLKDKVNLRYDPINIFKEIKMLIESKDNTIIRLTEQNKNNENTINHLKLDNKQLQLDNNRLQEQISRNLRNKFDITNDKTKKMQKSFSGTMKYNTLNFKSNTSRVKKNLSLPKESSKTMINEEKLSNDEGLLTNKVGHKDIFSQQEVKSFKDLAKARNNDKIYKVHGYQVSNIKEFRDLVDQTNRLFLYQTKMSAKFANSLNSKKFKVIKEGSRPLSSSKSEVFETRLKDNIVRRLNGIITSINKTNQLKYNN